MAIVTKHITHPCHWPEQWTRILHGLLIFSFILSPFSFLLSPFLLFSFSPSRFLSRYFARCLSIYPFPFWSIIFPDQYLSWENGRCGHGNFPMRNDGRRSHAATPFQTLSFHEAWSTPYTEMNTLMAQNSLEMDHGAAAPSNESTPFNVDRRKWSWLECRTKGPYGVSTRKPQMRRSGAFMIPPPQGQYLDIYPEDAKHADPDLQGSKHLYLPAWLQTWRVEATSHGFRVATKDRVSECESREATRMKWGGREVRARIIILWRQANPISRLIMTRAPAGPQKLPQPAPETVGTRRKRMTKWRLARPSIIWGKLSVLSGGNGSRTPRASCGNKETPCVRSWPWSLHEVPMPTTVYITHSTLLWCCTRGFPQPLRFGINNNNNNKASWDCYIKKKNPVGIFYTDRHPFVKKSRLDSSNYIDKCK